jgi:deoxycytidylate deaminase
VSAVPCLRRATRCVIVRADGRRYEARNLCEVDGDECPREVAGMPTGVGYELCRSTHAEANVAELARVSADVPGEAFLFGHTWACGPCQHALVDVNVRTIHLTGERA